MSLTDLIESNRKEISGSRTKNRLTVQISYAIQLIMDFYSVENIILMDYIEDISVICTPDDPTSIHLYQIKERTKLLLHVLLRSIIFHIISTKRMDGQRHLIHLRMLRW